jgi:tRNA dimethylallyltransferase
LIDPTTIPPDRPILLAGPTASGKSALALDIVARSGGVIINADALQVFDGWRILTARPDDADLARAPHLLYGHVPFDAGYSVGHWLKDITGILESPPARPGIVGGTGL